MNKNILLFSVIAAIFSVGCGGGSSGSSSSSQLSSSSVISSSSEVSSSSETSSSTETSSSDTVSSSSETNSSDAVSSSSESSASDAVSSSSEANSSSEATMQSWRNVKIGGGGYVPGLVFHPTTPNLLFARTDIGGSYRWNHEATEWIPITDSFGVTEGKYMGGESIALDPTDDNKVYMSTGMYVNSGNGRLSISSDRGDSWTHVPLPFPVGTNNQGRAIGERMMVDPNLPSTLFYGSRTSGLWKSTDSGMTWSQVTSLSSYVVTPEQWSGKDAEGQDLWITRPMGVGIVLFGTSSVGDGAATQSIYITVSPDYSELAELPYNIYKSSDGGQTWLGVETPVSGYHIPHMVRADDGMIYVAFTKGSGPGAGGPARLYKYNGTTWTLLKSYDPTEWTSFGFGGLSVSGSGATTRIALGITNSWGLWDGVPVVALSDDAGSTWREISGNKPHVPTGHVSGWIDDVEIDPTNPDHILHVHGGGVWRTLNASDPNPTWYEIVDGIEETASVAMVTPPAGASYYLLNSSLDIGTQVHTSLTTTPTLGPKGNLALGSAFSVDMAWSNAAYIATIGHPAGNAAGSYSLDSGVTWTAFPSFPPDLENNYQGQSNVAVSATGQLVWSQSNSKPYYTTDNGVSWHPTNLPTLGGSANWVGINRGYHMAADRQNPNKVYAYDHGGASWQGTSGKFFYSHDGGQTFTQAVLTLRSNAFHDTSLAVNPYVEGEVWLADGNSLYRSTDSGVTWVKLTSMQSVWDGIDQGWGKAVMFGAEAVALGVSAPGSAYSATVFMAGTINEVYGVYRSDDMGESWLRINDDDNQFGGIGHMDADHSVYGRVFVSGGGRGVLYNVAP